MSCTRRPIGADAAREHLETCVSFYGIVTEWWAELDPDDLMRHEAHMIATALFNCPIDADKFARRYRKQAYLNSTACETLVDDMAAGAKAWPT